MSTHEEDPAAAAGAKLAQAVAVAAAAAEAFAQLRATRATERASQDQRAAAAARRQLRAQHGADRLRWAPLLDADCTAQLDVPDLLTGWGAARCWPDDPEAQAAQRAAEQRLTDLRPDAMRRYTDQVAAGADPGQAMYDAARLFDQPRDDSTGHPASQPRAVAGGTNGPTTDHLPTGRTTLQDQPEQPATAPGPVDPPLGRVVDGEVTASRLEHLDRQHFPGALVVEAGAVAAAVAGQATGAALETSLPAAARGRT